MPHQHIGRRDVFSHQHGAQFFDDLLAMARLGGTFALPITGTVVSDGQGLGGHLVEDVAPGVLAVPKARLENDRGFARARADQGPGAQGSVNQSGVVQRLEHGLAVGRLLAGLVGMRVQNALQHVVRTQSHFA